MPRPNLVWVTMESTRADHTSLSDPGRGTTPVLRRIAGDPAGRSFEACHAHGIWTRASSASILTGTYPSRHGAGLSRDAIPETLPTVAERLREAGYRTACLSPNAHLSSASGLDRGFETFDWVGKSTLVRTVGLRALAKFAARIRTHGGGFTTDTRKHGTGFVMTDLARRRMRTFAREDAPFFLYLHLGGPHHPYHPPIRYLREAVAGLDASPAEASRLALSHHADLHRHIAAGAPFSEAEWRTLAAMYDGEITHTDALVGSLFDLARSLDGETVFVVTADHGELFGEQGLLSHVLSVRSAVSHVPLVVHGLDGLPDDPDRLVQHVDVVRTFLAAAGVDADGVAGVDLRREDREYVVVQRGGDRCSRVLERIRTHEPDFDAAPFPRSTVTALRTPEYRYEQWDEGSALRALPDESTDASARFEDVAADLAAEVDEWLATTGRPIDGGAGGALSDEMRSQLERLGYLVD